MQASCLLWLRAQVVVEGGRELWRAHVGQLASSKQDWEWYRIRKVLSATFLDPKSCPFSREMQPPGHPFFNHWQPVQL